MDNFIRDLDGQSSKAEKELQDLGKVVTDNLKPSPGPYALFHHQAHILVRIRDLKLILRRMNQNSMEDIKLSIAHNKIWQKTHPPIKSFGTEEVKEILFKQHELHSYQVIDYEAIFLFGTIALDQWALMVAYLMGWSKPEEMNFHKLAERLEKNESKETLSLLWQQKQEEMLWLNAQVRFYRNRFIVHVDRPWQRGSTGSAYTDNFQLYTPSPPGWLNDAKIDGEIAVLVNLIPEVYQLCSKEILLSRGPRVALEYMFDNIGKIQDKRLRDKVQNLMGKVGGATPDYKIIGMQIVTFVNEGTRLLSDVVRNHLGKVNLGKPQGDIS